MDLVTLISPDGWLDYCSPLVLSFWIYWNHWGQQDLCMCKMDILTLFLGHTSWKTIHIWANSLQYRPEPLTAAWLFTGCCTSRKLLENVFLWLGFAIIYFLPFFACKCSNITSQRNCWWMCSTFSLWPVLVCIFHKTADVILTGNTRW